MGRQLTRPIVFVVTAALLAVMALAVNSFGGSNSADAQAVAPARLSVADQTIPSEGPVTVVVELDPGSSRLGALTAALGYDADTLSFVSCDAGITGVCNDLGGEVAFARLSIDGLVEITDVVSIVFERVGSADTADLSLSVETAVDAIGVDLDAVELAAGVLSFVEASGALTGEVLDAATGETLFGVEVCVSSEVIDPVCATTSGLGTFRFDSLPSGTYAVTATDQSGVLGTVSIDADVSAPDVTGGLVLSMAPAPVDDDPTNDDAGDAPTEPVAGEAGTIAGRVVDSTGVPVFGLEVCATQPLLGSKACVFTTGTGEFAIDGLATGNYALSVDDPAQRYVAAGDLQYVGVNAGAGVAGLEIVVGAS